MKAIGLAVIMLAVMALLVSAAKPEDTTNATAGEKKETYGQCVVAAAQLRQTCYDTVKQTRETCQADAANATQCTAEYKQAKKQCKTDFKAAKKECRKIKHNFFETIRYSMK